MNYFEHEYNVRYVDGILEHSQEWQWLFDYVEKQYSFSNPEDWHEFVHSSIPLEGLVRRFQEVKSICPKEWLIRNAYIKDAWFLSDFSLGIIGEKECLSQLSTVTGKALLLSLWVSSLLNSDNDLSDFSIKVLQETNCYEIYNLNSIEENIDDINKLIDDIALTGIDVVKRTLNDNVSEEHYKANQEFYDEIRFIVSNGSFFNYANLSAKSGVSWEENLVRTVTGYGLCKANDTGLVLGYSKEEIQRARTNLENEDVTFLLESVLFYSFNVCPSDSCIEKHCNYVYKQLQNEEDLFEALHCPSAEVLSTVFKEKIKGEWTNSVAYRQMITALHKFNNPEQIRIIKKKGFPNSKEQRRSYSQYCKSKYKTVENMTALYQLRDYLEDEDVFCEIDNKYFVLLGGKFDELVLKEGNSVRVSDAFYQYMIFLSNVRERNLSIDKRIIQPEMLRIKELWTTEYYEKAIAEMHVSSNKVEVPSIAIEKYNKQVLANPIILARSCMQYDEEHIVDYMADAADNAISLFTRRMELSSDFPRKCDEVIFNKHDIDLAFLEIVRDIEIRKGYKFLNRLNPEKFVFAIYQRFKTQTRFAVQMFCKDEELYSLVKEHSELELIEYYNEISLAIVTQLYPLLECKIRKLVSLLGIFPYKTKEYEFMQANDPSSLLRILLKKIYDEQKSFENVVDLLFVYNTMYNSNILNVRNECIHGRAYITGDDLKYAFRLTLLCIHMISFRIQTISDNVSDLIAEEKDD